MSTQEFLFSDPNSSYQITLENNIILTLQIVTNSLAMIFFRDSQGNVTDVPPALAIYGYDPVTNVKKEIYTMPGTHQYGLCWTDNYTISYKNQTVFTITNKRAWDLSANSPITPYSP